MNTSKLAHRCASRGRWSRAFFSSGMIGLDSMPLIRPAQLDTPRAYQSASVRVRHHCEGNGLRRRHSPEPFLSFRTLSSPGDKKSEKGDRRPAWTVVRCATYRFVIAILGRRGLMPNYCRRRNFGFASNHRPVRERKRPPSSGEHRDHHFDLSVHQSCTHKQRKR